MPYFKTGLGYMTIYDTIRGVIIIGTYADVEHIRHGEPSPRALDMAQDYVLSLPKDWLPYIQVVEIDDYYKQEKFFLAVKNSLPSDILDKLRSFTEADGWKFVANAPVEAGYGDIGGAVGRAARKIKMMSFFEKGEGEPGKEFPIEEAEKEAEVAAELSSPSQQAPSSVYTPMGQAVYMRTIGKNDYMNNKQLYSASYGYYVKPLGNDKYAIYSLASHEE